MITTSELKKGVVLLMEGDLLRIADFQHVKQGRGSAYVRLTLRNVRSGATVTKTVQAGEKFDTADLDVRKVQYLYREGDDFYFMDNETFEQPVVPIAIIGDAASYIREDDTVSLLTYEGEVLDISLPPSVVLEVAETEPGYKGDTASGAMKPAIMSSGLRVMVPLFVGVGEQLRVDTRTGAYIERVG